MEEQRIADRALAALRGAADELVVVANDPRAREWFPGLALVADRAPQLGPLGGIEAGLTAAGGAAVLVLAWDMPFVPVTLLRGLRALGETGMRAVAPVHGAAATLEPLCAYYAAGTLPLCRALLESGERRAAALYEQALPHRAVREAILAAHGDPARLFLSVDSPDELARAGGTLVGSVLDSPPG